MAADKTDMQIVIEFLSQKRSDIVSSQSNEGLRASGQSAELLRVNEDDNKGQLIDGSGSFEFQKFGRGSGKFPPVSQIHDWLAFKKYGINYKDDKERKSIAWAIAKKIAAKGTHTHITGKPTGVLDSISTESLELLKDVLAEKKRTEILTDIKRIFN